MGPRGFGIRFVCVGLLAAPRLALCAADERRPAEDSDRYALSIHSETYGELFRRALLPGPRGALVDTGTVAPLHQYVRLRVRDVDTSWRKDSLEIELAAWGSAWFGDRETEALLDGDVQTANLRYHHGPLSLRLGRQQAAGAAARYVRFDGVSLGAMLGAGFDADAYAGFTVLPRWDARPGYHQLGSAADSLRRDPDALPQPERSGHWLGGGRLGWQSSRARAGVSFHEQHEDGGLARRTLGVDGRGLLRDDLTFGASGLLELDARRVQDARLFVDASPTRALELSLEYLHTEPALFLSRQSVLSVFSTAAYEELGGSAVLHVTDRFALEGDGGVEFFDESDRGARGEIAARVQPGPGKRTLVRVAYGRLLAPDNAYHSLRASLARRLSSELTGTLELYAYVYDAEIRDRSTSEVYSGTLGYQLAEALHVLWGASLAQSPYASFDAQTLVRIAYGFELSTWRDAR